MVGVHTPKFPAERSTVSVRYAAHRHRLAHPVVNDPEFEIWQTYGVRAWPTLVFIDPAGNVVGLHAGEAPFEALDQVCTEILSEHRVAGTVRETPLEILDHSDVGGQELAFPGKVHATNDHLYIADSGHHRIVEVDHSGFEPRVFGSLEPGHRDGASSQAQFAYPQGLVADGTALYVADTENHRIRRINRVDGTVETIAGTGSRGYPAPDVHLALEAELASPWDLALFNQRLFIAMAGTHQIWVLDLVSGAIGPYAGSGVEGIRDGPLDQAHLAQPSGLVVADERLLVVDSETSSIRSLPLNGRGEVTTVVGTGLFDFGDVDGRGDVVRLQHPLGIAVGEGRVFLVDTFNNKVKVIETSERRVWTFAGDVVAGHIDGAKEDARFHEPGGVGVAHGVLFIADTNNHAIRRVQLETGRVTTLEICDIGE